MAKGPRLRYVDIFPVDTDDGRMLALRDPMGIANEVILVSEGAIYALQYFDGEHSPDQIIARCRREFKLTFDRQPILDLIGHLDANYFLDNERTEQRKGEIASELLRRKVRPASHAGISYPGTAEDLQTTMQGFFLAGNGAGAPGPVNGLPTPTGIIAPHIDFRIGGPTYTHAYRRIAESPAADVYVILGTGHAGLRDLYSVLPIDFDTPLGAVPVDAAFIQALQQNHPHDLHSDLFLHRTEHTIEFQVVMLKQILGERPFKIVPILCSFSYHVFALPGFERERRIIDDFSRALRQTIDGYAGAVTVIASVDLAHVGPRYGDPAAPDKQFLAAVEAEDRKAIGHALKVDANAWVQSISNIEDRHRICGFSPIYTLLASTRARRGELLRYEQGLMDDRQSVVSYCSAALYE